MAELIEAEKLAEGTSLLARWRKTPKSVATYRRLVDATVERRREPRRGARLKWGKALDLADRFLCEVAIANHAKGGARLKLARNISLPAKFQFFDEESGSIYAAQIVWRQGGEIGCRLAAHPTPNKTHVERRMRNRYFAL